MLQFFGDEDPLSGKYNSIITPHEQYHVKICILHDWKSAALQLQIYRTHRYSK